MTCAIEPALLQRVDARDVRLARREPPAAIAIRVAESQRAPMAARADRRVTFNKTSLL